MKNKITLIAMFFCAFFGAFLPLPMQAKDAHEEWLSKLSPHDLYNLMTDKFREKKWTETIEFGKLLIERYSSSPFYKEAFYYNGISYYYLNDYQLANDCFTAYLKEEKSPRYFDQIIQYKFDIAGAFEEGNRRHMFGHEKMPKWMLAFEDAVAIYDEIIASLPRDELAAKSLFRKGNLLLKLEQYKQSVESFQTLIRRFPKHPLTPEAYLMINKVYFS
ncbi:MAG: tetratricopeptide repeat protein, partial [Simkania negevensis]|nr:tetratricopeptide repeat protein [Simkania negevensis]